MTTSGPNSPGTMGTGAGGFSNWSNTGNGAASDNAYATVSLSSGAGTTPSQELKATNFGFAISGTVDGIQVEIERKATADSGGRFGTDALVKLVKGGVTGGTNKADTTTHIPTSDTIASYGGAADLWGLTWLDSDINDSGFGVVVSYKNSATFPGKSSNTYSVDHIRITVYYTAGGGGSSVKTLAAMGVG